MKSVIIISATVAALSLCAPHYANANRVQSKYNIIQDKVTKYTEITVAEIPEAVNKTLAKDYAGYATEKAYKGDDGTFKVAVSKEDMKEVLIFNEKGEVIKVEVPKSDDKK